MHTPTPLQTAWRETRWLVAVAAFISGVAAIAILSLWAFGLWAMPGLIIAYFVAYFIVQYRAALERAKASG